MLARLRDLFGLREPWQRTLWIMFFAQATTAIGFSIIFPFLPLYVEDLGTNTGLSIEFWAGMVFSAQAITMMIASPMWGAVADRYGRKLMVERAMFGGAVIIALMAFARSAEELVLIRAVQGLVTGVVAASNALIASVAPRDRTGYAMGTIQVALWSGVALGPLLGGIMADAFGFRVPFLVTAVMLLIAGVLVHVGVKENFKPKPRPKTTQDQRFLGNWRRIFRQPGVAQTYTIRFMAGLTRSMLVPIMPLYVLLLLSESTFTLAPQLFAGVAVSIVGVSTITGLVVGVRSGTSTFSALYFGRLGDRIGHRRVVIGCALAASFIYLPQAFVSQPWQLIALTALSGVAIGGLVSAPSALLARYTQPGEEGAVYGLDNSVLAASRAVAPLVGAGIAAFFGLRATLIAASGVFLLVLVVAALLLPLDQTPVSAPASDDVADAQPVPAD